MNLSKNYSCLARYAFSAVGAIALFSMVASDVNAQCGSRSYGRQSSVRSYSGYGGSGLSVSYASGGNRFSYSNYGNNYGGNYGSHYGGGSAYYPSHGSYNNYSNYNNHYTPAHTWHNTSHYDYVPSHYRRHGNHYDRVPGGYQYHQTGHLHHNHR